MSDKSKLIVFTDLDDTLFQTLHKKDVPDSIPMGFSKEGLPLSYACPKQQTLLSLFMEQGTVIPTTARDFASFNRVRYPFKSFAVLNFGATVLLPGGAIDTDWHDQMIAASKEMGADLTTYFELSQLLEKQQALGLSIRLISDFGLNLYILVKHSGHDMKALDVLQAMWEETKGSNYIIRRNGNNLTLAPNFFNKQKAVQYLIETHFDVRTDVIIGAGDSLSDYGFMTKCDYFLTPVGSQLHEEVDSKLGGKYA